MEIDDIKKRLRIATVLNHYGQKPDRNKMLKCPFHKDTNASMKIYEKTDSFHCFGCGASGDQIKYIELWEKKGKHEAILKGASLCGETPKEKPLRELQETPTLPEEQRREALTNAFTYFKRGMKSSRQGKEYMQSRGLDHEQILCGYDSGTFHKNADKKQKLLYIQSGMLLPDKQKKDSYYGRFTGCVVFPMSDRQGNITGLYGRHTAKDKHVYPPGPHKGVYPCWPEDPAKPLILTESIIDAATLWQLPKIREKYNVLALYGSNGMTGEHKEIITAQQGETILFLDGDKAGNEGAEKAAAEIAALSPRLCIRKVGTPEGEDINSLWQMYESEEFFGELLEKGSKSSAGGGAFFPLKEKTEDGPSGPATFDKLDTSNPLKITFPTQTAIYHVKGGIPKALDSMKVTIEIENISTSRKSRQKVDLYEDRQTEKAAREAGEKLGLRADLIEMDLGRLTDLLDGEREKRLKENGTGGKPKKVAVPPQEQERCLKFLGQKNLMKKFNGLIEKAGITGEEKNRTFLFVIATSYKMPEPLHALVQGSSGSGKTYLCSQVSGLMPPEDVIRLTRVTESSFYNYGEYEIQYKLIVLEDIDGLKEEAEYAFRELQSNREISSSTSVKDEDTGQIRAVVKTVKGPIGSMATTTHGEIYEDNMSRIFLIAVDEGSEQTGRIIEYLNKKSSGMIDKAEEQQTRHFIQNCIRMLKPYDVVNPYANKILLPPEAHKIRRLTELFHAFVDQVTLINQYQRKKDNKGRLISEKEDVRTAIDIMFESIVLKVDELDGSLRQFYEGLKKYVQSKGEGHRNYKFTLREVRMAMNMSQTHAQRQMDKLLELEYVEKSFTGARNASYYKICYWDSLEALRGRIRGYLSGQLDKL